MCYTVLVGSAQASHKAGNKAVERQAGETMPNYYDGPPRRSRQPRSNFVRLQPMETRVLPTPPMRQPRRRVQPEEQRTQWQPVTPPPEPHNEPGRSFGFGV
jgi:hypothetical protein